MSKIFTLMYCVNDFQSDFSFIPLGDIEEGNERFLTENDVALDAPSEQTIKNILDFARSYEVMETRTGYVEMNLN